MRGLAAQNVVFRHIFELSEDQMSRVIDQLVAVLRDPQVEV